MEKLYLLSADIYRQAYLQILSADIIIGRTLSARYSATLYIHVIQEERKGRETKLHPV